MFVTHSRMHTVKKALVIVRSFVQANVCCNMVTNFVFRGAYMCLTSLGS
jgi:hypothetical protein